MRGVAKFDILVENLAQQRSLETSHYRRLRGARGTLIRSKSKMSGGKRIRFYTIEFYDIETGASEYASFSQKQLIR